MNELFADGHVVWKTYAASDKARLASNPADITIPHVAGAGNPPSSSGSNVVGSWLTFY